MRNKNFAIFILTHGRADKVITYTLLNRCGYTGDIYLIIDDEDKQKDKYIKKYGDKVIMFNKEEVAKTFDTMDNFDDYRAVVYARNACFGIAEKLGVEYFMQLDDDYTSFCYKLDKELKFNTKVINNLDNVLDTFIDFYKKIPAKSIAFSQGGDFIGGDGNNFWESTTRVRKCMNSFLCSTKRPFQFYGRINEDVNCYVRNGNLGDIFFTVPILSLVQKQTQDNAGGLTDIYRNYGTYVKSFYSVMISPSSVKINLMGRIDLRIHHRVSSLNTYPMIIKEIYKK